MTSTIIKTGGYEVLATVKKVEATKGEFLLRIESRLDSAKNPQELRTLLSTTCTQWGLEQLGREIYDAIMKEGT